MSIVRSSGVDSEEYSRVVGEIEALRERRVGIKNAEAEGTWRKSKLEEFKRNDFKFLFIIKRSQGNDNCPTD